MANCLINADYYGRQGLVILKNKDTISFSNPGAFRIEIEAAKSGGVSDPRNAALIKMFNLVNIGERAGSGIPNIYAVWKKQGWPLPMIEEGFDPERTTLTLSTRKIGDKKSAISEMRKRLIIEYLTDHASAKAAEIAEYIELKPSRARDYLNELIAEDIVTAEGGNKNRVYQLKS